MFHNSNFKIMKSNVQITAAKKEFKNGQNGYEVMVEGMEGQLQCKMNFTSPLKAMRYMFLLSKRLELQIDNIQLAALSLAYQRAKEAEQKAVQDAASIAAEVGEQEAEEPEEAPAPKGEEAPEFPTKAPEGNTILTQWQNLKTKHPEALLLFRCGDFYESYMEDAEACAQVLGITLTKRSKDSVPMAGFPYHALDTYLPKLIRAGKRVAICDQIEDPAAKNRVKRGITDMVSPGQDAEPKRRGRKAKAESQSEMTFNEESAA